jgi:hypothetical protein
MCHPGFVDAELQRLTTSVHARAEIRPFRRRAVSQLLAHGFAA